MKLSELKAALPQLGELRFRLPDGQWVPPHAHVTEVGSVHKHFIDCGGTIRDEYRVSFQLWVSVDTDHRLAPEKLLHIIHLAEEKAGVRDGELEVEFQGDTIQRFGLAVREGHLDLTAQQTACLAEDQCGIPVQKAKRSLSDLTPASSCCTPGGGCC